MKFFIILFTSFIINILSDSNNYQIYYKSQLRKLKNKFIQKLNNNDFNTNVINCVSNNITSLIPSILIKLKNICFDIDITTFTKNIIINYNRLVCDDDINNIYTLFW